MTGEGRLCGKRLFAVIERLKGKARQDRAFQVAVELYRR